MKKVQIGIKIKELNECGVSPGDDLFDEEEDENDSSECDNEDQIDEELLQDLNSISSLTERL